MFNIFNIIWHRRVEPSEPREASTCELVGMLPNEIWDIIAKQCDAATWLALRCTCKTLYNLPSKQMQIIREPRFYMSVVRGDGFECTLCRTKAEVLKSLLNGRMGNDLKFAILEIIVGQPFTFPTQWSMMMGQGSYDQICKDITLVVSRAFEQFKPESEGTYCHNKKFKHVRDVFDLYYDVKEKTYVILHRTAKTVNSLTRQRQASLLIGNLSLVRAPFQDVTDTY